MEQTEKVTYGAKDFLRSVRTARIEKRRCEDRLAELRAQCEKTTPTYNASPCGGGDSHKDALIIAAAEQEGKLRRKKAAYLRQIDAVEDFIAALPDAKHRSILRLRFVDGLGWPAVNEELHEYGLYYEERQMFRLYGIALSEARRRFPAYAAEHPEILPEGAEAV